MLMRDESVPVSLVVFDVLGLDGKDTMRLPYRRRRELLEALDFGEVCDVGPPFRRRRAERRALPRVELVEDGGREENLGGPALLRMSKGR
jgi:hypothetical protein